MSDKSHRPPLPTPVRVSDLPREIYPQWYTLPNGAIGTTMSFSYGDYDDTPIFKTAVLEHNARISKAPRKGLSAKEEFEIPYRVTEFIQSIVKARIEKGISVKTMAERLGTTVEKISEFESVGHDPTMSALRRYAHAAGVTYKHKVTPL